MRQFSYFLLFILIGCQSAETIDPSRLGLEYFPLEEGKYRVYQVSAIEYFFNETPDTIEYQLMERNSEAFEDLSGNTSYRIERLKRNSENDDWKMDSVWVARKNVYTATQVEHNVPIIKLSFPVQEKKEWDANSLNDNEEDDFELRNVNKPFTINDSASFPKTVTVIQDSVTDNILFRNIKKEIFAKEIGLIYKETTLLNFCADVECVGQDIIETGLEYKQWIIEYGEE